MKKKQLYWFTQLIGWMVYILLIWIINRLDQNQLDFAFYVNLCSTFMLGLAISHAYRKLILRFDWLKFKIAPLIPRVIIASFCCGILFFLAHTLVAETLINREAKAYKLMVVLKSVLNLSVNFMLWSLLYFLFHFIQNYRKEEIKNLQWEAHSREVELNRLKSQMNPHFIFNSMNTIRALISENPEKAKDAITQLSNILRSSMLQEKNKVIPLEEEMQLVKDYLNIEKVRYEDRLKIKIKIAENLNACLVPPFIIQTLVENAIKHGISQLPEGGTLQLSIEKDQEGMLVVLVENDGKYLPGRQKKSGFGIANSKKRIALLYGDTGSLSIRNKRKAQAVVAKMRIPPKPKNLLNQKKVLHSKKINSVMFSEA